MTRPLIALLCAALLLSFANSTSAEPKKKHNEVTDPAVAAEDADFAVQGEYVGKGALANGSQDDVGAQVIALGDGQFRAVVYQGGLPGAGWQRGDERFIMEGGCEEGTVALKGEKLSGTIAAGKFTIGDGKIVLERTERKSPTLGAEPPEGAIVLFDGSNTDMLVAGNMTPEGNLWSEARTKPVLGSAKIHVEFRLSWMPTARGQARSNSGCYFHECYEVQVLDSFGLEGKDNECGGIYKVSEPKVNMCLPPLTWQTYDVELTAPKYDEAGNKTANARITVRHNGAMIHDDLELPGATAGGKPEGPAPRGIYFQGHGNKVQYRNIWAAAKK